MPLEQLVSLVEDVVHSQSAHAPATGLGLDLRPALTSGRGHGIRTVADYLHALALVEAAIPDRAELLLRLRLAAPGTLYSDLYRPMNRSLGSPPFYWQPQDATGDLSRAWDVVTGTGYLDVLLDPNKPRQLVAIWPVWYALDSLSSNAWMTTLPAAQGDPPELTDPPDYVTWAGGLARAWVEWNRWRRAYHGKTPVSQWPSVENASLDPSQLQRAMARAVPRDDLDGFVDAINIRWMIGSRPADSLSTVIGDYYKETSVVPSPTQPHVSYRRMAFFAHCVAFATLSGAGTLDEAHVATLMRSVVPAALRRVASSRSEGEDEARTPWGQAALDLLANQFAAYLMDPPSAGPLGNWPSAGFGARTATLRDGTDTPLYGGWDLQLGDDDGSLTYAGVARSGVPGGQIASLVADLRTLGFTAPAAGTTTFDARVAIAVREFQIEASQPLVWVMRNGARATVPAWRRYLGNVHGIVDAETRRMLQLWLDLPRVQGEPAEFASQANAQQARNALLVVACVPVSPSVPTASAVDPRGTDLWGPKGTFNTRSADPTDLNTYEDWDFPYTGERHWTVDRLQRWGSPVAAEKPNLAAFGSPVPTVDVDVVPIGRYQPPDPSKYSIGGPYTYNSDHWTSTLLTLDRFQTRPRPQMPVRDDDWPVVFGMTSPETHGGYADVINAYDPALLSFGWSHWTYKIPGSPGELGALLAWYRWREPAAFDADFGRWGIQVDAWPVKRDMPGKYVAPIYLYGVRSATDPIANPFTPREPGTSDDYLQHTWMRSFRTLYRVQQALRRSDGLLTAIREFAVRRVWETLHAPWTGPTTFDTKPGVPVTIGSLFTSQQAVVAFMRYHINQPTYLFGKKSWFLDNAVKAADAAYRLKQQIPSTAHIDATTLADPTSAGAVEFQTSLIKTFTASTAPAQSTVEADKAVAAQLPGNTRFGHALSNKPGSYPGPEDQRNYV